jgi:hypothetical protein
MKTFRTFGLALAAVAAWLLGAPSGAAAEEPLNLLFFGNSFSMDNVAVNVGRLATADGRATPVLVADLEGGQTLDYHIGQVDAAPANNVNHASIAGRTWDYVVMQEFSTKPTHLGNPADFRADALTLYRRVRDHASGRGAGVTGVLFETWARGPGNTGFYPGSFADPAAMQAELRANYLAALGDVRAAEGDAAARLAPVGDAFEARGFAVSLYDGDLYHQSAAGALLASMVLYRTIYDEHVGDIAYAAAGAWAGVDQPTWTSLAATADAMPIPEPGAAVLAAATALPLLLRRRRPQVGGR